MLPAEHQPAGAKNEHVNAWKISQQAALFVLLAAALGAAGRVEGANQSQSTASPAPIPSADARVAARAKEWFHRFESGDIDRSQLNAETNAELTDANVRRESAVLKAFGAPTGFSFLRTYPIAGVIGYDFLWQFKSGRIVEMIAFDDDGKIAGIDFETFVKS
jgi:hypothetical protein